MKFRPSERDAAMLASLADSLAGYDNDRLANMLTELTEQPGAPDLINRALFAAVAKRLKQLDNAAQE